MDINGMIGAVIDTQPENERERLRAAMRLGARIAIENIRSRNPYGSDAKEALDELDGKSQAQVRQEAVGAPGF